MSFAAPGALSLLLVVVVMAAIALAAGRWRTRARAAFAGPQASRWKDTISIAATIFVIEAAILIVIAIARPEWGRTELTRERDGVDLVFVLDISQSMQATDVQPTRLGAAQQQLSRLIEAERGNRFGLVIFAGTSILRAPLTTDAAAMTELVVRAGGEAGLLRGGSDLGAALEQAGTILEGSEDAGKAVIVVSDGEDFGGSFSEQAQALREKNILILTAGIGTAQGSQLTDVNRFGTPVPKVDNRGQTVVTRLNEDNLKAAASAGGGRYLRLDGDATLLGFREDLARLERAPLGQETQSIPVQRFQVFVAAALALLAASWFVSLRLDALSRLATAVSGRIRPRPTMAMLALVMFIGACSSEDTMRSRNQEANDAFGRGGYQEALAIYQELIALRPDIPQLSYNAGNALHAMNLYERAIDETQRALPPLDDKTGAVTFYALGNHYFALEEWELAYDAYRNALLLDPKDGDAKHNLELTFLMLTGGGEQPDQAGGEPGGQQGDQQPGEQQGEPGQEAEQNPQQPDQQAQPGTAGQPQPGQAGQQAPGAEVTRQLEEALRGLDESLTVEEAQRILELLQQQQQGQRLPGSSSPAGPDY